LLWETRPAKEVGDAQWKRAIMSAIQDRPGNWAYFNAYGSAPEDSLTRNGSSLG